MPDRMSNRMSEDMSDRMPEDLPVRKCINVMVGITRSKVIFYFFYHSSERKLSEARAAALWPAKTFQLGRFDTAWDTYDIIIHHL